MRDDDDCFVLFLVQFFQKGNDDVAGFGVEVAGRLVGEDDFWIVDECACDGDALHLSAGELVGIVVRAVFEPDKCEDGTCFFAYVCFCMLFLKFEREHDIFECGKRGDQIELLEDKTYFLSADGCKVGFGKAADVLFVKEEVSGAGIIKAAEEVHHGAFAGSAGAEDDQKFAFSDSKCNIIERSNGAVAHVIELTRSIEVHNRSRCSL